MTSREALLIPLRQRYPFLPILALGISGILLGENLPWPSPAWLSVAAMGLALFLARKPGFAILVIGVFAAVHLWQDRESPAAQFAKSLGGATRQVTVVGLVDNEPRVFTENRAGFRLRVESLEMGDRTTAPDLHLLVDWSGPPPGYRDKVEIRGTLQNIEPIRNPGQFDFTAWAARHGLYSRLKTDKEPGSERILDRGSKYGLTTWALAARAWMRKTLEIGVNDKNASELIVAMVLGDTSELPDDVEEEFRGTGTYHLFSVSGLHVGMLALLIWTLLRVVRLDRRNAALVTIPLLFFYTLMTGLSAASVRSAIMASIVLAGFLANRKPVLFNNLCAAAFLILLADTNQLFDAGFQLSFTVVGSIVLFAEPLSLILQRPFQRDEFLPERLLTTAQRLFLAAGRELAATLAVSLAAWAGSFILIVIYFHMVSLTTLPANLVAVPVSFGIMAVSLLSLLAGLISPWVAAVFNQTNWLLAKILLWLVHSFASLPGSYFYTSWPEIYRPVAEVVVFDFGNASAVYVESGGQAWLVDCGPAYPLNHVLIPYLRSRGVTHVDGLFLAHADSRHIGAVPALLEASSPREITETAFAIDTPTHTKFLEEMKKRNLPLIQRRAGEEISLGGNAKLKILFPPNTGIDPINARECATILQLSAAKTKVLLALGIEPYVQKWLIKKQPKDLVADVLVESWPKDQRITDQRFLETVNPHAIIIEGTTAMAMRRPWSPPELIGPKNRKIPLFAQDEAGAVLIKIYEDHFVVSAYTTKRQYVHSQ